jgi:hypothetical protein
MGVLIAPFADCCDPHLALNKEGALKLGVVAHACN